jgi:hypothetical protein
LPSSVLLLHVQGRRHVQISVASALKSSSGVKASAAKILIQALKPSPHSALPVSVVALYASVASTARTRLSCWSPRFS